MTSKKFTPHVKVKLLLQWGSENRTLKFRKNLKTRNFQFRFWDGRYDSKTGQICPVLGWSASLDRFVMNKIFFMTLINKTV